jgi:hypothetical protein
MDGSNALDTSHIISRILDTVAPLFKPDHSLFSLCTTIEVCPQQLLYSSFMVEHIIFGLIIDGIREIHSYSRVDGSAQDD